MYQPRCKSLSLSLSRRRAALSRCALTALTRTPRQACAYLPTYERLLRTSLLTPGNVEVCRHVPAHVMRTRGPFRCREAEEALPTRANACLAPFHPRLFPPLTHLLTLRDGNSDQDDVHKPGRNFMRRNGAHILQHALYSPRYDHAPCAPSADRF